MKFLCDRCKTRYSIGDDRVRGKILKIRCKNCANVITVREGMPDADAVDPAAARRTKTATQAAPTVGVESQPAPAQPTNGGRGNALGAAFASAMTKPPPALEEEWYVSIDGDQAGPFTLAEAQRWVAGRTFDAELHCWSEGFDDWLPVDKVSHFRGLRKKPPPPAAPPPLPRIGTGPARAMMARGPAIEEEEPKPLFAATMASLEKAAAAAPAAAAVARGLGMPTTIGPGAPAPQRPSATPPTGQPAYTNGSAVQARANPTPIPSIKPIAPTNTAKGRSPSLAVPNLRTPTAPGVGTKPVPSTGGKPALGFDSSELGDSATQLEAVAFDDEAKTTAEPIAAARKLATPPGAVAAIASPGLAESIDKRANNAFLDSLPKAPESAAAFAPTVNAVENDESDDIDIGEVSRVVKLADLARSAPRGGAATRRSGPIPTGNNTTSSNPALGRLTGSVPKLGTAKLVGGTMPVPLIDAVEGVPNTNGLSSPVADLAAPAVAVSHRRGMIVLLIGAVMLVGAAVFVVAMVLGNTEDPSSLGGEYDLRNERPDQVVRRPGDPPVGAGSSTEPPVNPFVPKPKWKPPVTPQIKPDVPPAGGNSLKAEEIESMAGKNSGTTQRCWMRSQRGADGITLADVKKITVTLTVNPDGTVTDVQLSDNHAANSLGKCLSGAIRLWKFRTSPGGTFRFILHFG